MRIEIWLVNTAKNKKRFWRMIENNIVLEMFLAFLFGQLEPKTTKSLKIKDVYAMAGYASIYLMNYKEPKIEANKVLNNQTLYDIEKMRMVKGYAINCVKSAFTILSNMNPNEKLSIRIR